MQIRFESSLHFFVVDELQNVGGIVGSEYAHPLALLVRCHCCDESRLIFARDRGEEVFGIVVAKLIEPFEPFVFGKRRPEFPKVVDRYTMVCIGYHELIHVEKSHYSKNKTAWIGITALAGAT